MAPADFEVLEESRHPICSIRLLVQGTNPFGSRSPNTFGSLEA
jgi:hypothetical protein